VHVAGYNALEITMAKTPVQRTRRTSDLPAGSKPPARRRTNRAAPANAPDQVALTTQPPSTPLESGAVGTEQDEPSYNDIAYAAYLRYLQRGGAHGNDFDDWLEAERELKSKLK
jgi:hypothetical protein